MKTILLMIMIVVFLSVYSEGIQAQTTNPQLDQTELMKQFLGTWKMEMAEDAIAIAEYKPFGNGIDGYVKIVTKGETIMEWRTLIGCDKKTDTIIQANLYTEPDTDTDSDITLFAVWFTSKNSFTGILLKDISNPEEADYRVEVEIKSPDLFTYTYYSNNISYKVSTLKRE
jgi:hypothetical protein